MRVGSSNLIVPVYYQGAPSQWKGHVKIEGEDHLLQVKERGTPKIQPCHHLDLELLASRNMTK